MAKAVMRQNSSLQLYLFKILIWFCIQPVHYTGACSFLSLFLSTQDLLFFWTLIGETGAFSEVRRSILTVTWNPWLYTFICTLTLCMYVWGCTFYYFISMAWSIFCSDTCFSSSYLSVFFWIFTFHNFLCTFPNGKCPHYPKSGCFLTFKM